MYHWFIKDYWLIFSISLIEASITPENSKPFANIFFLAYFSHLWRKSLLFLRFLKPINDTFYYKVTIICNYWGCISNKLQENEIKQLFNKNTLNTKVYTSYI